MAAEYERHDVVLKLSRVEGMFGPPLEGFHRGATCVVTPVTGHDEYVEHGVNGLVIDWDDERGTARALDLLARDASLLHLLRSNALATARGVAVVGPADASSWRSRCGASPRSRRPTRPARSRALAADARAGDGAQRRRPRATTRACSRAWIASSACSPAARCPRVRQVANRVRDRRGG